MFSAVLNLSGALGRLLLRSQGVFYYISPGELLVELQRHRLRLAKRFAGTEAELDEALTLVAAHISVVHPSDIPAEAVEKATALIGVVDPGDVPFVALAIARDVALWTGDLKLLKGLKAAGFDEAYTTQELLRIRELFEDEG